MSERLITSEIPSWILESVQDWYEDNKHDNLPSKILPSDAWKMFLEWNGIIGYDSVLHRAHEALFKEAGNRNDKNEKGVTK